MEMTYYGVFWVWCTFSRIWHLTCQGDHQSANSDNEITGSTCPMPSSKVYTEVWTPGSPGEIISITCITESWMNLYWKMYQTRHSFQHKYTTHDNNCVVYNTLNKQLACCCIYIKYKFKQTATVRQIVNLFFLRLLQWHNSEKCNSIHKCRAKKVRHHNTVNA